MIELRNRVIPQCREFIQVLFAMNLARNHHSSMCAQHLKHLRDGLAQFWPRYPHKLRGWPGWIEKWSKEVEDRSLPALGAQLAGRTYVFKRRMITRSKEKC